MFEFPTRLLGLALACTTLACPAVAQAQGPATSAAPVSLTNGAGENQQWSGIGRLHLDGGRQCIGTLIDTRDGSQEAVGPAYVVTAGHCVSLRNGVIVQDQPLLARIAFNYFVDTVDARSEFTTRRVVWSSMQGSDLALLELDATLQQVMSLGIEPLKPSGPAAPGSEVLVIGDPVGGTGLRLSTCTEHDQPFVQEGEWVWRNAKRNDCQGVSGGVSGSPVIDRASNRMVSVVNSINTDFVVAIPVARLLGCFKDGQVDLERSRCALMPGFQFRQSVPSSFSGLHRLTLDAQGLVQAPHWNLAFSLDTPRFRFKTVRDPLACETPEDYSGTLASDIGLIDEPIGVEPGWHYLCVLGVESAELQPWPGLMANALSLPARLLDTGEVATPQMQVERQVNGDIKVTWVPLPPHIMRYRAKYGAPATTDCDDPKGYGRQANRSYLFKTNKLPVKLCTIAIDGLNASSAPRTDLLPASDS